MRPTRLVFVSANALTRSGITHWLSQTQPSVHVVGAFADFQGASDYLRDNPVDVLLIDGAIPRGVHLIQALKALRRAHVGVAVVIILERPTASLVQALLAHGARGILHKDDDLGTCLIQAIIWSRLRGIHLSPGVTHLVDRPHPKPAALCQRDFDVLQLLADGLEPKDIAPHLSIGINTVYRSLGRLRLAFNARNNAHLIMIWLQGRPLDE